MSLITDNRRAAARYLLAVLPAMAAAWALPAQAQSSGCDQFKDAVATRIPPDALGTLETVPASTPVPPGAKVVGTCDGGAFKILHYRRGVVPQVPGAAPAASAASAVGVAPRVAVRASAPAAAASRPEPAKPPETVKPEPAKPVPVKPAAVKPPEPLASPSPSPSPVAVAPAVVAATPDPGNEPLMRDPPPPPPDGPGLFATAADALVEHWPWTLAAVLLLLLAWGGSWLSHRRVYDSAGLPRGPKL
jgi:hypothetical protein